MCACIACRQDQHAGRKGVRKGGTLQQQEGEQWELSAHVHWYGCPVVAALGARLSMLGPAEAEAASAAPWHVAALPQAAPSA